MTIKMVFIVWVVCLILSGAGGYFIAVGNDIAGIISTHLSGFGMGLGVGLTYRREKKSREV